MTRFRMKNATLNMFEPNIEYIAVGGNRQTQCADWNPESGVLAYGAAFNVALATIEEGHASGVRFLLRGHEDTVNAVRFLRVDKHGLILSGSSDQTVRLWHIPAGPRGAARCLCVMHGHSGSVTCLATQEGTDTVASGAADATVRIWRIRFDHDQVEGLLCQAIALKPGFTPLALALHRTSKNPCTILVVAGTKNDIFLYAQDDSFDDSAFIQTISLSGHEGWIRSVDLATESDAGDGDIMLASASQDKYVRIWRISWVHRDTAPETSRPTVSTIGLQSRKLSGKALSFSVSQTTFTVRFESLLTGHEDWVHTVAWGGRAFPRRLLSASADNSVALWEPEPTSGIWNCVVRLGEVSVLKGSTTATGSFGGLWIALWGPGDKSITALGRTGSWRLWRHQAFEDQWVQRPGISGHYREVRGLAWARDGSFLVSISADQTTRIHGCLDLKGLHSWHELARAQIHGYDLACVDTLKGGLFVSGAEEKLLRVFTQPRSWSTSMSRLLAGEAPAVPEPSQFTAMPTLGLSNKAAEDEMDERSVASSHAKDLAEHSYEDAFNALPNEDVLARHTLWPEIEKLYGHGFEISAVAASHDGLLIASACRSSSPEHAVIRLYETASWREVKPPLKAHSLTVNSLKFSPDDEHLLSVGRDRQHALFRREKANSLRYHVLTANPKSHSRMILGAAWAPGPRSLFATAGRDKSVKVWELENGTSTLKATIAASAPVNTVDFFPSVLHDVLFLAYGTEAGDVSVHSLDQNSWSVLDSFDVQARSDADRMAASNDESIGIARKLPF